MQRQLVGTLKFTQLFRGPSCRLLGGTQMVLRRFESKDAKQTPPPPLPKIEQATTPVQRLKKAVADYGSTVIVFHVGISLVSLGGFYLLVSSGLDVPELLCKMGLESQVDNKVLAGAGTFALAYGVHKVFAPVRIMITLSATPFLVRYLRHAGFIKPPPPSPPVK